MLLNGSKINKYDKCVYVKVIQHECIIVYLYVDDILIMSTNKGVIKSMKKMLNSNFDMKHLGLIDVILGIRITKNSEGYVLS